MKVVKLYLWRYLWVGKTVTSPIHYTEEDVRREHPEAVVVPGSEITRHLPDTPEEIELARYRLMWRPYLSGKAKDDPGQL